MSSCLNPSASPILNPVSYNNLTKNLSRNELQASTKILTCSGVRHPGNTEGSFIFSKRVFTSLFLLIW